VWLHNVSDALIWLAYFLIPVALVYFVRRRRDVPFSHLFWLFGAFIILCGTTHLMEVVVTYWPAYRLAGVIKLLTGVVSLATVAALVPVLPRALALRSPAELERAVASRTAALVQANDWLRESEERFRLLVEGVKDYAIFMLDSEGQVVTWNAGAERLKGYRGEEIVGQHFSRFHPREAVEGGWPRRELELAKAKGRFEDEGWRVRKDGTRFWTNVLITPLYDEAGVLRGFSKIIRDLTERRRSEEMLRSVLDHVIDGIITIDSAGTIESFNPAAEKLFGYQSSEVIGRNVKVLMPEPYHGEHDGYIHNYLTTAQAKIIGIGREVVGRRKDGSTFPMELAVSEFHMGEQRFFTGIVRDITERKQLEQELRQRLEDLAEADQQKNAFLAMLAHELRNPLAPMRNALYLMKMPEAGGGMVTQARDMMERQLHCLVRLVDDLLDVSRIIRSKIELKKEPVDLAVAVARAVETAQPVIDAQGHRLAILLPAQPLWVEADLIRLAQVIANLLMNAAKYTDEAGRISLTVERDGEAAVVCVRDSGVGIPPELLPRIFDLFVQGDRSLARSQGGLGIGLTLVKRLVEMHGGGVTATSAGAGRGSEFTVRLPALPEGRGGEGHGAMGVRAHVTDALRKRVLVVDDNVDAAESIAMILRVSGHDVRCVHDGPSALQAAKAYRPDVVVLDIGLPGMSGYHVARQLREQPEFRRTPLVAMTGYGQEEDHRLSQEAGFDHHLTKPVDPDALQAFIARAYSCR
jgi:PAS domain S-box-containing protein